MQLSSNPTEGERLKSSFRGAELSLPAEVDLEAVATVLRSIQPMIDLNDGYVLLYKRLSNRWFQWPRLEVELRMLDQQSFRWLMIIERLQDICAGQGFLFLDPPAFLVSFPIIPDGLF